MAPEHTAVKRGRILTGALALAAATFVLPAGCEEQPSVEPRRPPGIAPATTAPTGPEAIPPEIAKVYRALAWTEQEKNIWEAVNDYDRQWRETAFFAAMQRVRKVHPLPREDFNLLDCPSYGSLVTDPRRYRAKPIRLSVYVYRLIKLEPGKDFAASRRWPVSDGPIWRMDCGNAMAKKPADEPLSVFCAFDPSNLLGGPYKVNENGPTIYTHTQAEIAGVFYKIYRDMSEGDKSRGIEPELRSYPVVLTWQVFTPPVRVRPSAVDPRAITIILVVAALAIAYLILRRTTKRQVTRRRMRRTYRPLRTIEMKAEAPEQQTHTDQDNQQGDIDPLLKAASERYRKEKGLDHGQDREGRTGPTQL